jgi:hypothetical protein
MVLERLRRNPQEVTPPGRGIIDANHASESWGWKRSPSAGRCSSRAVPATFAAIGRFEPSMSSTSKATNESRTATMIRCVAEVRRDKRPGAKSAMRANLCVSRGIVK